MNRLAASSAPLIDSWAFLYMFIGCAALGAMLVFFGLKLLALGKDEL